ncbi:MAG: Ig-like domain-containing protein [Deltaproteobacteria bacterium]|nr:Ig-like domain-containing protein [Deltaproteobacteria bacterium]
MEPSTVRGIVTKSWLRFNWVVLLTAFLLGGGCGANVTSTDGGATELAAKPDAPTGVTATAGNQQVTLSWTAVSGATKYTIYYGTSTGVTPANGIGLTDITSTSYVQGGLTNGTTYYYVITATNSSGEGDPSSEVSATPTAGSGSGGSSSDTTAPSVSSLKTAGGTTIEATGTTGISVSTAYTLTFSEAMDTTTVSTSNVTLSCNSTSQTITVAAAADSDSISNNEFTITPSSNRPQGRSCTTTAGTGVKDSAGNALASAKTFTYTTRCATNDDFSNGDTLSSCYTAVQSSLETATITGGALSITVAQNLSTGTPGTGQRKTFASSNLTVTVRIPTFSGLSDNGDGCSLSIIIGTDDSVNNGGAEVGISSGGANNLFARGRNYGGGQPQTTQIGTGTTQAALAGVLVIRLTKVGSTFTPAYSTDNGATFTNLTDITSAVGSTYRLLLGALTSQGTATDTNCQFDDLTVTGGSATGQD